MTILDIFKSPKGLFNVPELQLIFKSFTTNLLNEIKLVPTNFCDFSYIHNFFNNTVELNLNTVIFLQNQNLINDIVTISVYKNDVINMIQVCPDYELELEVFDFTALEMDEDIYEVLSTPDFKLYYPEPYIASPSFNHEDL